MAIDNNILVLVNQCSKELPLVFEQTKELHYVKGSELLEQGETEADGAKIDTEKMYKQWMPVQIAFNHKRRMYRAYIRNGMAGITDYLDKIIKIIKSHEN